MEKKYVTTPRRRDGLGAQVTTTMTALLLAKLKGLTYVHKPFTDIARGISPERAEAFFNLGHGELQLDALDPKPEKGLFLFSSSRVNPFRWGLIAQSVKDKYYLTPKTTTYDSTKINVAFHVRRGDITREHVSDRFTENEVVLAIQKRIATLQHPFAYHLFSQGEPKDFEGFDAFQLHLDEDPLETFHHLVAADVLIMAKSSFSYAAALLSEGIKVYEPHWHPPVMDWIIAYPEIPFDVKLLAYKLGG